jgi:hypothetical protein
VFKIDPHRWCFNNKKGTDTGYPDAESSILLVLKFKAKIIGEITLLSILKEPAEFGIIYLSFGRFMKFVSLTFKANLNGYLR